MGIGKKYKLYVFDLDGTLIDTRVDIARAFQHTLETLGFEKPDMAQVVASIGRGSKNAVRMLTGLEGEDVAPVLQLFVETYDDMCSDNTTIYEGGEMLLRRLKSEGALLALVTMKFGFQARKVLKSHGLDMFDDVIAFDDTERHKPEPDCLLNLLDKYGLKKSDALMVGDMVTDIRFAKAAGVDACAMTHGYGVTEEVLAEMPTYQLNTFLEF